MAATSTAARKSAARKKSMASPAAVLAAAVEAEEGEVRASVVLDPDRPAAPVDMFPIFAIGDRQFYAPLRPAANVELRYLHLLRHAGTEMAAAYLLEELLGAEGYAALMDYDRLEKDDLTRIITALRDAVQGAALADPKEGLRIT